MHERAHRFECNSNATLALKHKCPSRPGCPACRASPTSGRWHTWRCSRRAALTCTLQSCATGMGRDWQFKEDRAGRPCDRISRWVHRTAIEGTNHIETKSIRYSGCTCSGNARSSLKAERNERRTNKKEKNNCGANHQSTRFRTSGRCNQQNNKGASLTREWRAACLEQHHMICAQVRHMTITCSTQGP